ncbi:MAG TPA: alpha/beta fold hydrolase, partial [Candidatus Angelobacter sp.]
MIRVALLLAFFSVVGTTASTAQVRRAADLTLEPYVLKTFDGKEHPAELGKLWVSENRERNPNRRIQLAFVRLKTTAAKPGPPIIFLMGGPGIPGTVMGQVPPYFTLFDKLREISDVVLLDQRGTGMSSPNLQCEEKNLMPPDMWESREKALREFRRRLTPCADHWKAQGANLAAYTTNASADDVEDLRRAIGAERISLLAFSYGTELALATVRRHGEKIDRVVLQGVRAPDIGTTPADRDIQLQRVAYLVATDPSIGSLVPDMTADLKQALAKFDRGPLTLTVKNRKTAQPVAISIGKFGFQSWLGANFANPEIPALLYTMKQGDNSILTKIMED